MIDTVLTYLILLFQLPSKGDRLFRWIRKDKKGSIQDQYQVTILEITSKDTGKPQYSGTEWQEEVYINIFVSVINCRLQKIIIFVCVWARCIIKNVSYSISCLYGSTVSRLPKKNMTNNILCTRVMCILWLTCY